MLITPFETTLYEQLTPFFEKHQFTLLPEKKQYRRTTDTGFQNVIFYPAFYSDETLLDVSFGCRNNQVEQIAQQFLMNPPILRPDANTVVVSIGKFTGFQSVRFRIHSAKELADICAQIEDFFNQSGFNFLVDYGTLPTLNRILNEQPGQPCPYVYNQMHRCYKGLITAHLTHNVHFNGLIALYRQLVTNQTQSPYEHRHFERLIDYLHHYSAN